MKVRVGRVQVPWIDLNCRLVQISSEDCMHLQLINRTVDPWYETRGTPTQSSVRIPIPIENVLPHGATVIDEF